VPKIIGHGFVPRTERRDAVYLSPKLSSHIHAFVWLCFGTNSASPRGDVRVSGRANTPSWEYRIRLTGRLRNTASCLTAAPLSHSVTHSHMRWVGAYRHRRGHGRVRAHGSSTQSLSHSLTHALGGCVPPSSWSRPCPCSRQLHSVTQSLTHTCVGWVRTAIVVVTAVSVLTSDGRA
jgi:hypothetical protein